MKNSDALFYMNSNNNDAWLSIGVKDELIAWNTIDWDSVNQFLNTYDKEHIVTLIGYDAKNSIEKLESNNEDLMQTPDLAFILPETVYHIQDGIADLISGPSRSDILVKLIEEPSELTVSIQLQPSLTKEQYVERVESIKKHIQQGDLYELNFCQRFEAKNIPPFDYLSVYKKINEKTRAPFSTYINWKQWKMIGTSPERYIKRIGPAMISQPIKGTRKRGETVGEDSRLKEELRNDIKERAENVMIVDLVRNDLAKVALSGTVKVDELFGVYSFETVHQMISTISCTLQNDCSFSDIIKATFPMGSMTGAPKVSSMKKIEELEDFKRGWFSGSVGMLHPRGDFDLNVVIRTLLYNEETGYLSCPVGGAITDLSTAEKEYDECLLKIERIISFLNQ
jgi:para-aminobenzoate synthetase component I